MVVVFCSFFICYYAFFVRNFAGFLQLSYLFVHVVNTVFGEQNLLAHDVDLHLQCIVVANRVVKPHHLVLNMVVKRHALHMLPVLLGLVRNLFLY